MSKVITIFVMFILLTGCYETKNGEKIGRVVKIAKEGIICNSWEVQLIRGGLNDGSGSFGTAFNYTVENKETLKKLQIYMENQKEIKISYHKELITFCRSEDESDNYFVDSVELIK